MIIRHPSIEFYQDRTKQTVLFSTAIEWLCAENSREEWKNLISRYMPVVLPKYKRDAREDEILYAADLIREFRPHVKIKQTEFEYDESLPTQCRFFDLEISKDDWNFAHTKSADEYDNQIEKRIEISKALDAFSLKATEGKLDLFAQHRDTLKIVAIDPQAWNVGNDVLWSRYISGFIDPVRPGSKYNHEEYIVLMRVKSLKALNLTSRQQIIGDRDIISLIIDRLEKEALINKNDPPGGSIQALAVALNRKYGISVNKMKNIIRSIPRNTWSYGGRPTDKDRAVDNLETFLKSLDDSSINTSL